MRDPLPENIDGRKEHQHVFEHRINWGHVVLGAGIFAAAYIAYRAFVDGGEPGGDEAEDLPEIEVREAGPQFEDSSPWRGMHQEHTQR